MVSGDRIEKILTPRPHTLTVAGWPATLNALAWSADASIAIALDDCVELLIPKIDIKHLTSNAALLGQPKTTAQPNPSLSQTHASLELEHWYRLRLQTNTFTVAEWPYFEPQLCAKFDVGEEQGLAGVAALEWSNAGLGRFGRCALGVLTANGVLSIWADGGRIREEGESGWKRRAIVWGVLWKEFRREMGMDVDESAAGVDGEAMDIDVEVLHNGTSADVTSTAEDAMNGDEANHPNAAASNTYNSTRNGKTQHANNRNNNNKARASTEQLHAQAKKSAILHKRCRIRSFRWTQVPRDISNVPNGLKNQAIRECTNHLLIVTNDYDEIIVLQIRSPYDNPLSPSNWHINIVSVIDTKDGSEEDAAGPQLFSLKRGLHSISINEWTTEQGKEALWTAFIAYGKNNDLEVMRCTLSYVKDEIVFKADRNRLLNMAEHDVVGPMCWAPELNAKEMDELFVPLRGSFVNLAFHHARPPTKYELGCTQNRDDWSSIAGTAITSDKECHLHRLHYTPHMPSENIKAKSDSWSISSVHDHTSEAVWLKALHQHGEEFSDAYELFNHIDYRVWGMASAPDHRHVAICYSLHPSDLNQYVTHAQQVSFVSFSDEMKGEVPEVRIENCSESNMYTLSNWLRGQVELDAQRQTRLLSLRDSFNNVAVNLVLNTRLVEAKSFIQKADDLQSLILAARYCMIRPERLYALLAKGSESITMGNQFGQISSYSRDADQTSIMLELITSIMDKVTKKTPLGQAILGMWGRAVFLRAQDNIPSHIIGTNPFQEQCELCDAPVVFESMGEARCRSGHQFTRCALTLLTIQEPGVSKFCAICHAQYYQEDVLVARERQDNDPEAAQDTMTLHNVSLTQLLFLAVDRCLFCGGKFRI